MVGQGMWRGGGGWGGGGAGDVVGEGNDDVVVGDVGRGWRYGVVVGSRSVSSGAYL